MTGAVPGVRRGCGKRVEGGVYIETNRSPEGRPVEHFLADPPFPYEPDHKVGQEIVERDGVFHVIDWIGASHYPYASDFLEEVRAYGLSRRVSSTLDFGKLTRDSRIIVVHAKAYIENAKDLAEQHVVVSSENGSDACRCGLLERSSDDFHLRHVDAMCSRYLWYYAEETGERTRRFVDLEYEVFPPARHVDSPKDPVWKPGIIASFPAGRLAVIRARDGSHAATVDRIRKTGTSLDVAEEDE